MIKYIEGAKMRYTICVKAIKESVDFFNNGELDDQSSMIKLDIMEEADTHKPYYAIRIIGSIWSYVYWWKRLKGFSDVHLGWQ